MPNFSSIVILSSWGLMVAILKVLSFFLKLMDTLLLLLVGRELIYDDDLGGVMKHSLSTSLKRAAVFGSMPPTWEHFNLTYNPFTVLCGLVL